MQILPLVGIALAIASLVTAVVWGTTAGSRREPDPDVWRSDAHPGRPVPPR